MKKRVKGICTLLLAGALAATLLPGLPSARAAIAVETNADCKLKISIENVGTNYGADYLADLTEQPVDVKLYKVADIDATGTYTATTAFTGMDFSKISSTTTADDWDALVKQADGIIADAESITPDRTITIAAGDTSVTAENLGVGLYLIAPQEVTATNYTYSFRSSLVSLPNNYYYDESSNGDDTWVYELIDKYAINLKPEQTPRLGDLELTKTLSDWSSTAGGNAMFIFEISYTTLKGETDAWQEVMNFTGAGEQSIDIKKIPAGATVTVKEVYSGAAYTLSGMTGTMGDETVTGVTGTDGVMTLTLTTIANDTVTANITNTHNNTPNGGSGIVNHYETDDEYGQYQTPEQRENGSTTGRTIVDETETTEQSLD